METNRSLPADSKPIMLPRKLEIARKPKILNDSQPDALATNGLPTPTAGLLNGIGAKRKRSPDDSLLDQEQLLKRKRGETDHGTASNKKGRANETGDDMIVLDDSSGGAIVIDDE